MSGRLTVVLLGALFCTSASAQTTPFGLAVDKEPGFSVFTFQISDGTVRVYLPDELHPGERFSGTVVALTRLTTAIDRYSIEFAGQRSMISNKTFQWTVPGSSTGGYESLVLKDNLGRVSAAASVPLSPAPDRPWEYPSELFPKVVQAGGTATILGDFDGDSRTMAFDIGGQHAPVLVESPHYAVVQIPRDLAGTAAYSFTKGALHKEGTVQSIQVKLQPGRNSLRNGESATLVMTVAGLRGLKQLVAVKIDNWTPSLATIVKKVGPDETLPYIWIRPEQVNREGVYVARFNLSGSQPGPLNIQAHIVFPQTRLEEVAMILRQPRKDFAHWPVQEHAQVLRVLPYETTPLLARLLVDGSLGYEAAGTLLELDPDNGLSMIFASMPENGNVHIAFSKFLREYFTGPRRFEADAHDAAVKVLQAGTSAEAAIEALWVVGLTGSRSDFPLLEKYTNYQLETQSWEQRVRDAAEGGLARLGSARHLAKIKQELIQAKSDSLQTAMRLDQILEKAGFTGSAELIDAICPHVWAPARGDYDLIAIPAESAAVALSAIADGRTPILSMSLTAGGVEKWKQSCQARGFGPR